MARAKAAEEKGRRVMTQRVPYRQRSVLSYIREAWKSKIGGWYSLTRTKKNEKNTIKEGDVMKRKQSADETLHSTASTAKRVKRI